MIQSIEFTLNQETKSALDSLIGEPEECFVEIGKHRLRCKPVSILHHFDETLGDMVADVNVEILEVIKLP